MLHLLTPLRACAGRLVLAAGLAATAQISAAAEKLHIFVAKSPLSLPVHVAQANGYFAAEGLDIQISDCSAGFRCLKALVEGQADLATVSELPIVFSSFERSDFAVIGTFATAVGDPKLVVAGNVANPDTLVGKRVGVVAQSNARYMLDLHLFAEGVDPRTVTTIPLQPEHTVRAFASGAVDALATIEPTAYQAIQARPGARVLPVSGGYIETFNLVAHRRLVGHGDATLTAVLRAIERAELYIQASPALAKTIMVHRLGVDARFADWIWPGFRYRLSLEQSLVSTMENQARWALREGFVKDMPRPNFHPLIHAAPLRSVKPAATTIAQ